MKCDNGMSLTRGIPRTSDLIEGHRNRLKHSSRTPTRRCRAPGRPRPGLCLPRQQLTASLESLTHLILSQASAGTRHCLSNSRWLICIHTKSGQQRDALKPVLPGCPPKHHSQEVVRTDSVPVIRPQIAASEELCNLKQAEAVQGRLVNPVHASSRRSSEAALSHRAHADGLHHGVLLRTWHHHEAFLFSRHAHVSGDPTALTPELEQERAHVVCDARLKVELQFAMHEPFLLLEHHITRAEDTRDARER